MKFTIENLNEDELIKDINSLLLGDFELNLNKQGKFSKFCPIYSFTTENIAGYMTKINMQNAFLLTVCGSGDHIINSFLCGANEVQAFDINILSALITELKLVALEKLSYKEFLEFFMRGLNAFNYKMYKQLRNKLSKVTKTFFDNIYKLYDYNGYKARECKLFNNKYDDNKLKIMSNLYLKNEELYIKAKQSIKNKNVNFINSSFQDLNSKISEYKKFNVILLSNISDYANTMFENSENYLVKFFEIVGQLSKKSLKNNGIICAAYIYNINEQKQYRSQIDNPIYRQFVLNSLNIKYYELNFDGIISNNKDLVLIFN